MRLIQAVRSPSCLAVFCLLVPAVFHGAPASAAQTETLDNGAVTATFEDGALVRLRNTASNRVLELSGDSATMTVNGEKFAAPGRKLIATERRPDGIAFKYEAGDKQFQVVYELKPGWQFRQQADPADAPGGRHVPRGGGGGAAGQREDADRPRAQGQQRQRRGVSAAGRTECAAEIRRVPRTAKSVLEVGTQRRPGGDGLLARHGMASGVRAVRIGPRVPGPVRSDRRRIPGPEPAGMAVCPRAGTGVREPPAAGHGRVRRRDAVRGRLRAVPPAEKPARSRAVVRKRLPDRRGQARGPRGMETHPGPVRRGRRRTLAVHARQQRRRPAEGQRRRLGLGVLPVARPGPEDPQGRMEHRHRPDPAVDSGNSRLRQVEERQAGRLRLPDARLEAEPRVDRVVRRQDGRLRRRGHRRPQLPGLVRRSIGRVSETHGDQRLQLRSLVDRLRADEGGLQTDQQVRPVVRLPPHPGGTPPPHPGRGGRRPPAVPVVRPVDVAGRLVPASRRRTTNSPAASRISPTCISAACPATGSGGRRGTTTWSNSRRGKSCPDT